jgi:hypothetical protein
MATRPSRGRKAGPPRRAALPDEATAAVRSAIRAHVPEAIRELARLAHEAVSEQARVSAINALLDRGYGDLKRAAEADEDPSNITVRFVGPAERA